MAEITGCYGCEKAQWDADGCTCGIDGLLVGNAAKGCTYRVYDEEPETVSDDYERGFKNGLKAECLKELKPAMAKLIEGCTEAIKGITPMMIENAQLHITHAVNRWIPCSERLPEVYEKVLTYNDDGIIHDNFRLNLRDGSVGWSQGWGVTHWQPRPEPPEKE